MCKVALSHLKLPGFLSKFLLSWFKVAEHSFQVIRRKSFSVVLKIPYVKIQIFRNRSFKWFVNYFLAKFLKILTTGSLEIGKFLRRQSVSIFRATAHVPHLTGFLGRLLEGSSGSFRLKQTMCK